MIPDLMTCRAQALAKHADISKLDSVNGKRKDNMELMKDLWEEKGYASLGLTTHKSTRQSSSGSKK